MLQQILGSFEPQQVRASKHFETLPATTSSYLKSIAMPLSIKLSDGIDVDNVTPGTLVKGTVELDLPKQKNIANANISFIGKVVTEFSEVRIGPAANTHGPRRHAVERHVLFNYSTVLFPGPFTVPGQKFQWPFEFQVPWIVEYQRRSTDYTLLQQNIAFARNGPCFLPPTFEWRDSTTEHVISARIKYKLLATVDVGRGLFKRTSKQKLPIIISTFGDTSLTGDAFTKQLILSTRTGHGMRSCRFTIENPGPLQATIQFPDRFSIPYPGHCEGREPKTFWLRFAYHSLTSEVKPQQITESGATTVVDAILTLYRTVNVRIAPVQRLMRNVGTKTIASGGQGYTTDDVLVTRSKILLPASEEFHGRDTTSTYRDPNTPHAFEFDISAWFQSVSDHLTGATKRNSRQNETSDERKTKNVTGFKSCTVGVQYSITVEFRMGWGGNTSDSGKHCYSKKVDIPIHLDGYFRNRFDDSEIASFLAAQHGRALESVVDSEVSTESGVMTKEQEAFQEKSENTSHSHEDDDVELPRYEETSGPPPLLCD